MRVFLIGERAEYRLLARTHVEVEWSEALIVEHRLGEDPPLDPEFAAAGFDAVLMVGGAPTQRLEALAANCAARPEFPPVVLVLMLDPPPAPAAAPHGVFRLYGRKIERDRLIRTLAEAAREHKQRMAARRAQPDYERRYRFGAVMIRGHRCIRQIGSGGMCKIFLAESERAGTIVVLKVFSQVPDVSERIVGFDRFLQEYEIVARLRHRHIVRIHDLGVADDHAYIAMEHFPAGDLRQRMKAPMAPADAAEFLAQTASALDAIHSVGVLHRDLKPANIMLRNDGSLCLIDFGLAKANELDADLTGTREIFGTPYYMSPEQGHAETIDARSDLYSLGVVFYEMLSGRKPYTGTTAMEVIYKHRRADLPPLPAHCGPYERIARRLLAKAPDDRFQTARELLDALGALKAPA